MTQRYATGGDASDVEGGRAVGLLVTWAGAIVSLALLAGLALWGWQLLVRDVAGVPVVRAIEGPMRIAPQDPGGDVAPYRDLSVTRVASIGAEEAPADRVVLAPAPVQLADEDLAVAALIPDTASAPDVPEEGRERSAIELALMEAMSETGMPESGMPESEMSETDPMDLGEDDGIAVTADADWPSPARRPKGFARTGTPRIMAVAALSSASRDAVAQDPSTVQSALSDPISALEPGAALVQLGAFPQASDADDAWSDLEARVGEFLVGKTRLVQEAQAGGSTFYRLRAAGFSDLSEARRFCAVLVAERANCIPIIRR